MFRAFSELRESRKLSRSGERSNRAYVRFEDAWTFPPYSQSNTLVNASVQNIGSPWVQDLISIFDCWERIGVRQEEMEFEKYKLVFPTAA
ncbi:hypothetical protein LguiA_036202 [Lonicera macranthoides]